MAHLTQIRQSFMGLIQRLDKNPVGAPFAEAIHMIRREAWPPPPKDTAEKFMKVTREKGKL